jgi:hypothetical protein
MLVSHSEFPKQQLNLSGILPMRKVNLSIVTSKNSWITAIDSTDSKPKK